MDLSKAFLLRMTHIENLPHILQYGITHRLSTHANPTYKSIGDPSLISTRSNFVLENGRLLGDYIPFYFGGCTPMLYVIQKGFNGVPASPAQDIVYCVTSVQKIMESGLPFVFTDGHAVDHLSTQYEEKDINRLEELLDWQAIKSPHWKSEIDLDLKRRKQAEFLILGDAPPDCLLGFVVYNEAASRHLKQMGLVDNQVHVNKNYYFEL